MKKDKQLAKNLIFFKGDLRKKKDIERVFEFSKHNNKIIEAVVHLAGLKSVTNSFKCPKKYVDVNINGSVKLFEVMKKYNCNKIVYSSSASIYDPRSTNFFSENSKIKPFQILLIQAGTQNP